MYPLSVKGRHRQPGQANADDRAVLSGDVLARMAGVGTTVLDDWPCDAEV